MLRLFLSTIVFAFACALPAAADTVLRGSGETVWIEKDGSYAAPSPTRKGFTRVETSPYPKVQRRHERAQRVVRRRVVVTVEETAPGHVHEYTPVYSYPSYYRYRVRPTPVYRPRYIHGHYPYHGYTPYYAR